MGRARWYRAARTNTKNHSPVEAHAPQQPLLRANMACHVMVMRWGPCSATMPASQAASTSGSHHTAIRMMHRGTPLPHWHACTLARITARFGHEPYVTMASKLGGERAARTHARTRVAPLLRWCCCTPWSLGLAGWLGRGAPQGSSRSRSSQPAPQGSGSGFRLRAQSTCGP